MLKLYKNITPNIENNLYYYFTDFQQFLTELGTPYMSFDKNSYQINNNVVTCQSSSNNIDVNAITYVIDYDTDYYRCYHVTNANLVSGYMYFNVSVDLWGSFIAKCSLENIVVTRCNRNIGDGVYEISSLTDFYSKTRLDENLTPSNVMLVVYVLVKTGNQNLLWNTATTAIKIVGFNIGDMSLQTISYTLSLASGIYGYKTSPTGSLNDCTILKAFLMPSEYLQYSNTGNTLYFETRVDDTTYNFYTDIEIKPAIKTRYFFINPDYECNQYVGVENDLLKITNKTKQSYINTRCIVQKNDLKFFVEDGENQKDISSGFAVTLTTNEGVMTTLDKIQRIIGVTSNLMGNINFQSVTSSLNQIWNIDTQSRIIDGGSAENTFTAYSSPTIIYYPLILVKYQSRNNEKELIKINGAIFNEPISNFIDIFNYSFLIDETINTFIQADAIVKNVCIDAMQTIKNALRSGIYVKHLSIS